MQIHFKCGFIEVLFKSFVTLLKMAASQMDVTRCFSYGIKEELGIGKQLYYHWIGWTKQLIIKSSCNSQRIDKSRRWITLQLCYLKLLSRAIPRQQFEVVQSKVYPLYFRAMVYCIGIALVVHVLGHRRRVFSSKAEMLQVYILEK